MLPWAWYKRPTSRKWPSTWKHSIFGRRLPLASRNHYIAPSFVYKVAPLVWVLGKQGELCGILLWVNHLERSNDLRIKPFTRGVQSSDNHTHSPGWCGGWGVFGSQHPLQLGGLHGVKSGLSLSGPHLATVHLHPLLMIYPRRVMESRWMLHFSALATSWFSNRQERTMHTWLMWCS